LNAQEETVESFELRGEATPLRMLLVELWRSGPLIVTLARQNFYVRYRRASFGMLWAVALPLVQTLVLAFVFSKILRIGRIDHFVVFILAGITAWTFFNSSVQSATTSIVEGANLSTRIYFPRMVFPLVVVGANVYGFLLSVTLLVIASLIDGLGVGLRLLWLLPAALLLVALTTGFSIVFSGLHVYFRDMRYLVQAAFIGWLYATPVIYSLAQAHGFASVIAANPATGVVLLFRAALLGRDRYFVASIAWSLGWSLALLVAGLLIHRRYDRVFADLL
jgi:lipopolysaccharide transport system permease protein